MYELDSGTPKFWIMVVILIGLMVALAVDAVRQEKKLKELIENGKTD
jgi:hypothetical protein